MPVVCSSFQEHLGIYLVEKASKGIGVLGNCVLPRNSLINIYQSFIWPHLDYGAIIFDLTENESFCKKLSQFNIIALAITGEVPEKNCIKN